MWGGAENPRGDLTNPILDLYLDGVWKSFPVTIPFSILAGWICPIRSGFPIFPIPLLTLVITTLLSLLSCNSVEQSVSSVRDSKYTALNSIFSYESILWVCCSYYSEFLLWACLSGKSRLWIFFILN